MGYKIILALVTLAFVFCISGKASAMTATERQTLITQIQAQIVAIMQQIVVQQQANTSWCYTFNNNLGYTVPSAGDILNLHVALQKQGISYGTDSVTAYSTGTFGGVIQFQQKYGITPSTGYVDLVTRTKLNQLYGCNQISVAQDAKCKANCLTQSDGLYSVGCSGSVVKCAANQTCQKTYSSKYVLNNGVIQTVQTVTGTKCVTGCTPSWKCGGFGICTNGQKVQTCTDANNCGVTTGRPSLTQTCTSCTPLWKCGGFGPCVDHQQTQTCVDTENCGVTTGRPSLTKTCTTCNADCLTQTDGIYAIGCTGNITKCATGQICQKKYTTNYTYNNNAVQTYQTLTGVSCVVAPSH